MTKNIVNKIKNLLSKRHKEEFNNIAGQVYLEDGYFHVTDNNPKRSLFKKVEPNPVLRETVNSLCSVYLAKKDQGLAGMAEDLVKAGRAQINEDGSLTVFKKPQFPNP